MDRLGGSVTPGTEGLGPFVSPSTCATKILRNISMKLKMCLVYLSGMADKALLLECCLVLGWK